MISFSEGGISEEYMKEIIGNDEKGYLTTAEWNRIATRLEREIENDKKTVAYLQIKVSSIKNNVYEQLSDHEHVIDVRRVLVKSIDYVAEVYGNDTHQLNKIVQNEIGTIPGILKIKTIYEKHN